MFNGLQLSVAELREKIMDSKKLGLGDCFTLEIMDAHTKKGAENLHVLACQSGEERRKREGRASDKRRVYHKLHALIILLPVYKDDKDMVSRNSSVIIMRVPKPVQQKLPKTK